LDAYGRAASFGKERPVTEIDVFAALANPVRREILVRLRRGPRPVTALAEGFDIGRPAISEHLQVLRRARLVREEPRGRERYYHLDPRPLADVEAWVGAFARYWKARMTALEEVLREEEEKQ
jgi:DNA-binding transcriptional ArsR family regulator